MKRIVPFSFLVIAEQAFAEVSDKVPSVLDMWLFSLGATFVVALVALRFRYFAFIGFLLSVALMYASFDLHTDKYVYSAIVKEQGRLYIFQAYFSSFVLGLASIFVFLVGAKSKAGRST